MPLTGQSCERPYLAGAWAEPQYVSKAQVGHDHHLGWDPSVLTLICETNKCVCLSHHVSHLFERTASRLPVLRTGLPAACVSRFLPHQAADSHYEMAGCYGTSGSIVGTLQLPAPRISFHRGIFEIGTRMSGTCCGLMSAPAVAARRSSSCHVPSPSVSTGQLQCPVGLCPATAARTCR